MTISGRKPTEPRLYRLVLEAARGVYPSNGDARAAEIAAAAGRSDFQGQERQGKEQFQS